METEQDRPDARFWTTYDHFMLEREARALRRREMGALAIAVWRKVSGRAAQALKHAGAQPMKQRSPA